MDFADMFIYKITFLNKEGLTSTLKKKRFPSQKSWIP